MTLCDIEMDVVLASCSGPIDEGDNALTWFKERLTSPYV